MARISESDIGDKILGGTDLVMDEMLASTGVTNHLQWVAKLCGSTAANHAAWANDEFALAFTRSGVNTFKDLILLGSNNINDLSYTGPDPAGNPTLLGRFDIGTAVMTLSRFRAAPRRGHLDRVKRILDS